MAAEVTTWGMPFDAIETLKDDGSIGYDNVYDSQDFADWIGSYFSNGILVPKNESESSDFEPKLYTPSEYTQSGKYRVRINPGKMVVNGRTAILEEPAEFQVDYADIENENERKDRIVVELDLTENANRFIVKVEKGVQAPAETASEFPLIREGAIYQMSLAVITMTASGSGTIEDTRWITNLCGISNVLIGVKPPEIVDSGTPASEIVFNPESSGLTATNVQLAIDELAGADHTQEYEITLLTEGWDTNNQQTVDVSGLTSSMTPIFDVVATSKEESEEWCKIYRIVTGDDVATFFASDTPSLDLNVQIKVVI